jgi:hypothetical protein
VTIRTHVGVLKVLSVSEEQLNGVIDDLRMIHEEIMVHEEDSHDYLGMIMTHDIQNQTIKIDMKKYISGCIEEFINESQMRR